MKLQGPTPGGSVSFAGMEFRCDKDGVLEVLDANAALIATLKESHGFVECKPPEPAPAADEDPADGMKRPDMLAFLEARGVKVPGNISNALLRKAVEEHKADPVIPKDTE